MTAGETLALAHADLTDARNDLAAATPAETPAALARVTAAREIVREREIEWATTAEGRAALTARLAQTEPGTREHDDIRVLFEAADHHVASRATQ